VQENVRSDLRFVTGVRASLNLRADEALHFHREVVWKKLVSLTREGCRAELEPAGA